MEFAFHVEGVSHVIMQSWAADDQGITTINIARLNIILFSNDESRRYNPTESLTLITILPWNETDVVIIETAIYTNRSGFDRE
jgi:hypothetical protein